MKKGKREKEREEIDLIEAAVESGEELKNLSLYSNTDCISTLVLREKRAFEPSNREMLEEEKLMRSNADCRTVLV